MDDTSSAIKQLLAKKYAALTGAQWLEMGSNMYDIAREIVLSSLPKNLPEPEKRRQFFLRFYGNDFNGRKLDMILRWIQDGK